MLNRLLQLRQTLIAVRQSQGYFYRYLGLGILTNGIVSAGVVSQAIAIPCQLPAQAIQQKENLRQAAIRGNRAAQNRYRAILSQHARQQAACRQRNWPRHQAIWLRLYPCDIRPGSLERIMDRIVNKGYNQVYVEVFYASQVLLPQADNPTPWQSVVKVRGAQRVDLLAQAIQKGRQRGLKVYAWLYSMNFGSAYAQRPDRRGTLARNGFGHDNLSALYDVVVDEDLVRRENGKAFIDPYNAQARADYQNLVQAVIKRRPDGVLFDYVRYPRSGGGASVATRVQDLWIYGDASLRALYRRASNNKGQALIYQFLSQGYITAGDIAEIDALNPEEGEPLWQGRNPNSTKYLPLPQQRQPILQQQLWLLTVTHAVQGILDFLQAAIRPVQQQRIRAGAVFFPSGNRAVGQGYDSRIQPWDQFPSSIEWHPMLYKACGNTSCIVGEMREVLSFAQRRTEIKPALAGVWGKSIRNRPPLEVQMQAIRQFAPRITTVSHFAFSWQEAALDRERKFCRL